MKIIFLSHTPRNAIFKVGSYHLSNEFARMGHEVLYIPSAVSLFHFLNIPALFSNEEYRQLLKSRLKMLLPMRDEHDILNLTPLVLTPFTKGIFDNPNIPLHQWFTFNSIAKKIKNIGFQNPDLVIQDKVGLYFVKRFIQAQTWIYRATDDYSNMPGGPGKASIQELEKVVCEFADKVVVTSQPLSEIFKSRYQVNPEILRNGVDVNHFSKKQAKPAEYQHIEKPIILYLGSLDNRFDLDLLLDVARKDQRYHYVIVGPNSKEAIPGVISNITALGPKPYELVPAYMQHADLGILPLKLTEANHARSPMKMYEYGICGLPVVSTPLKELQARNEEFIAFAENPEQFYEQIKKSMNHKKQLSKIAKEQSKKHSWNSIAKKMLELSDRNYVKT